jgi:hypothetical protein
MGRPLTATPQFGREDDVAARSPPRSERLLCGLYQPPPVLSLVLAGTDDRNGRKTQAEQAGEDNEAPVHVH